MDTPCVLAAVRQHRMMDLNIQNGLVDTPCVLAAVRQHFGCSSLSGQDVQ